MYELNKNKKNPFEQKLANFLDFLAPESDIMVQFLKLETDIMVQFLEPETVIMGERNYILQKIILCLETRCFNQLCLLRF